MSHVCVTSRTACFAVEDYELILSDDEIGFGILTRRTENEFLDEQIRLSPRGPEWTVILRRRREGLRSFCLVPLISGHIRTGHFDTWVKIDPKTHTVVFWEQLEYNETV